MGMFPLLNQNKVSVSPREDWLTIQKCCFIRSSSH